MLAKPQAWGDASWTFDLPTPYAGVSSDVKSSDDPRFRDEAGAVGHLGVYAAVGASEGILPKPLPETFRLPAAAKGGGGASSRPAVPVILSVMAEEADGCNVNYGEFVPGSDAASEETLRRTLVERLQWRFLSRTSSIVDEILEQPWYAPRAAAAAAAAAAATAGKVEGPSAGAAAADANSVVTPQRSYSRIVTDLRMRCGLAALADALAEGAHKSHAPAHEERPNIYHVIVDQGPGPGDAHPITGDWSLGLFYTPRWAFHGWDLMLLFGWALPWPAHQYSAADRRLQRSIRSAYTEFGATGAVRGWKPCDWRDEGWCSAGTLHDDGWGPAPGAAEACGVLAAHFGVWNYTLSG